VPIITFVNKLNREGRDPFDLLDEIEQSLALDVTPASWPISMGRDLLGTNGGVNVGVAKKEHPRSCLADICKNRQALGEGPASFHQKEFR